MKRIAAVLLSVVFWLTALPWGAVSAAMEGNIITNGDFEDGKTGWSCNSGTAEIVSDAYSGNSAIQLTNPSAWGEAAIQTVEVQADTDYTVTWYSKRVSGRGAFNFFFMSSNGWSNLTVKSGQNWMNETSGNWVKNEVVLNTGATTQAYLKLSAEAANAGSILIDNITMIPVGWQPPDEPDVPSDNLLINGDFETGDETGWETYNDTAVEAEARHNGSYGLHLQGDGTWAGIAFQDVPVKSGVEYTITMWLKTVSQGVNIQIKDGSSMGSVLGSQWFNTFEWTLVEFVVIPTTNTLHINFCGGGNGWSERVYVDDVTVTAQLPAEPSNEMITNGDFETGDYTGWDNLWGSNTISITEGHDSAYAMSVISGEWRQVRQKVDVEPNTDYVITGWYKNAIDMTLLVKDQNDMMNLQQAYMNGGADWTQVTLEVNSGDNWQLYICLMGNNYDSEGIFDDLTMYPKGYVPDQPDDPTGDDAVINGDFETGDFTGWQNPWGNNDIYLTDGYTGYGMEVYGCEWSLVRQYVEVRPYTDYVFTVWYKDVTDIGVLIKDGNDVNNLHAAYMVAGSKWTQLTVEFNSGNNRQLYVGLLCLSDAAYGVFDDFTLTRQVALPTGGVINGDFELGNNTGWNVYLGTTIAPYAAYNGNYGLHLTGNGSWDGIASQNIPVESGVEYTVSMWVKVESNGVNIHIRDGGEDGAWLSSQWFTNTKWTQLTFTVTPTTDVLCIHFVGSGSSWQSSLQNESVYVDDITLVEGVPGPDYPPIEENQLINGDFEEGDAGWRWSWDAYLDYDNAYSGESSVYLSGDRQWQEALTQTVLVRPNTDYVITFYTKRAYGNGAWSLWVMDAATANYYSTPVNIPLKSDKSTHWFNQPMSAGWVKTEVEFNSGDVSAVFLKFGPDTDNAGDFWLDDVSMYVKGYEPVEYPPYGANQLRNGGFEEGAAAWNWHSNTELRTDAAFSGEACAYLNNDCAYSDALTQTVRVYPDTDYVVTFYTKRESGTGAWCLWLMDADSMDSGAPVNIRFQNNKSTNWFNQSASAGWVKTELEFNSGDISEVFFKFGPEGDNVGTFWLDDVSMYIKGAEPVEPDYPQHKEQMNLISVSAINNRPMSEEVNLLENGSFEVVGGQWTVDSFCTEHVSVVEDTTTKWGSRSLYFDTTSSPEEEVRASFTVAVEPYTTYIFSVWIKGAFLSADNCGRATIGVADANGKFLSNRDVLFLDGTRQLVPSAWDDAWHLGAVQFDTGSCTTATISMAGWGSQMWVDDMALYEVANGMKYVSENMGGNVEVRYDIEHTACKDEDSLIPDPTMSTADAAGFWAESDGWRNGFMSFKDGALKYTSTGDNAATYTIKWVDVEPYTDYTFSVDLKILEDGFGRIALLDSKKLDKVEFYSISFDSYDYTDWENTDWRTVAVRFNSDAYDRIGIAFVDDGGEVLLDNMRLFKTEDGMAALIGDVNGDGTINTRDVGLLQRYLSGWDVIILTEVADVNGDGKVNVQDIAVLQRYLCGWDVRLGG